jgi:SAM-dependent methyltransferase
MGLLDVFAKRATAGGPFSRRDYRDRGAYRPNYQQLASALVELLDFEDHLDIGCGQGLLLEPLLGEHGKDSYGVEGSPAALEFALPHVRQRLRIATLQELKIDRQYDLVSCVEVLEHVPEGEADRMVALLTRAARRFIYFSAAIPGQSGVGHINCQPTLFWLLAFDRQGWQLDLPRSGRLRERIVGMQPCWWLPQNALIFAPKSSV